MSIWGFLRKAGMIYDLLSDIGRRLDFIEADIEALEREVYHVNGQVSVLLNGERRQFPKKDPS